MEQTDNITKHLSASNIPSSTMTSKKMDQVQIITKNVTEGNRIYSTRIDQTANIIKHLTASDIASSTKTGKNESSKKNLVRAFSDKKNLCCFELYVLGL